MDQMTLERCERLAKDDDAYNCATFDLVGPGGTFKCRWIDAYFGMFQMGDDNKHFVMASELYDIPGIHVENYQANK
ncbi:hypothetical protein [Burkholderia sp. GbtcB21]|uniref:hypothetical protein n=1 Tax=Burkholderia sp. GbtcB21 TaxID=2824766 RepID=UPI001C2F5FA5|nr:hypothetical protein [Burkholderia sp. GbtcB21]